MEKLFSGELLDGRGIFLIAPEPFDLPCVSNRPQMGGR